MLRQAVREQQRSQNHIFHDTQEGGNRSALCDACYQRDARNSAAVANSTLYTLNSTLSTLNSQLYTPPTICAFLRITSNADEVLSAHHCRSLAQVGNIHIADIPLSSLAALSCDARVSRIEAKPMATALLDSVVRQINAVPVHEGRQLPQAFTGKGVVMGVMDIGFDLTHPNFYNADKSEYRIQRVWDMLSVDTLNSRLYVGRDYTTTEELLSLGCTRDGRGHSHGTHTLGIAAGSGWEQAFQGLAPESDICLVANATSNNAAYIDSALYNRFTFATDALGFKYIFDYARSVNRPCVISFSEGSSEDFLGYDQLYYEMLDSLQGPGRIIVSAAGNNGHKKTWFRKEPDEPSKGTFIQGWRDLYCTFKSSGNFLLRLVAYGEEQNDTLLIPTTDVLAAPDSSLYTLNSKLYTQFSIDSLEVDAYPSCYDSNETCYDLILYSRHTIGGQVPVSIEVASCDSPVEFWRGNMTLLSNDLNPQLCAGEPTHSIFSPASAPRVICVGATNYRDSVFNTKGEWQKFSILGEHGKRAPYSSMGPTADGRTKPDVMAPGTMVVSSFSSFFREEKPDDVFFDYEVGNYDFMGRVYSWIADSGTSMACPAVAGTIALWLQARPDLTPEEALDVIRHTSRPLSASTYDPTTLTTPNNIYGYGEIDAYRGLLYLLGLDGIETISHQQSPARFSIKGRQLTITLPEGINSPLLLRIYSLNGQLVHQSQIAVSARPLDACYQQDARNSTLYTLNSTLSPGLYAVQLDGDPRINGSSLIRIE